MRILVIHQGEYGRRHLENIRRWAPQDWTVQDWKAPAILPPVIDYPEEFLPEALPPVDLILSLGENPGVAELLPEIARRTGARAVIAPADSDSWLPRGLANQLHRWLNNIGVQVVTPRPFCALTETGSGLRTEQEAVDDPYIAEFARFFGRPAFRIQVDPVERVITSVEVLRDASCGCARYVAEHLVGMSVDDVVEQAGMLHHHYPCQASMAQDPLFHDTLMHVSGNLMRDEVAQQVRPHVRVMVFTPEGKVE
jgi:hypothetical protein